MDLSLFDLQAGPETMRDAASGWRTLATDVGDSWYEVARKRIEVVGDTWSGDAAESYRFHAGTLAVDLYDSQLAMSAIADALDSAADDTAEAQGLLDARLSALAEFLSLPSVMVRHLTEEDLAAALEAAQDDARRIRGSLDDALRTYRDDIMEANNTLRQVGERWLPVAAGETTGWAPPPPVAGVFNVLHVGDQVIVDIPDGVFPEGWFIDVTTDPETGERVFRAYQLDSDVVIEFYRTDPETELVIRPGASYGWIDLEGRGITLIGSPEDDVVLAGPGTTVLGLGGDDRISGDTDGRISGGAGDDDVDAWFGSGGFQLSGGLGNDTVSIHASDGHVSGGEGDDEVRSHGAPPGDGDEYVGQNVIDGGAGDDTLTAQAGGNTLRGGPGSDNLVAAPDEYHSGEPLGEPDQVVGQGGRDDATIDEDDTARSTEDVHVSR